MAQKPILTGIPASIGIAEGAVRIVRGHEDAERFEDGDVLVTTVTDPTMTMMMSRAAAIVCDLGSIVTHAAIISRELGIPCVVGTRVATTTLKNGQRVRVDGTKGEVHLLGKYHIPDRDAHIEDFLNATVPAWAGMDYRTFNEGIDVFHCDPLFAEPWLAEYILPMLEAAEAVDISHGELARSFHNPGMIRCLLAFDLLSAKFARAGIDTYLRIFDFYATLLTRWCVDDPYASQGKNVIHNPTEIERMIAECKDADPNIARTLGQVSNACYNLSYGLYGDMNPEMVYDNFGPYYQPDGKLFALKIFHNLKPLELWPQTHILPVEHIDIGVLFDGVTMRVDPATHAIYEGNQIENMRGWWCTLDGTAATIAQIEAARREIENVAVEIYKQVRSFDVQKRKELYYRQKAYVYKNAFSHIGFDRELSAAVLERVRHIGLYHDWNIPDEPAERHRVIRAMLDPRVELPMELV